MAKYKKYDWPVLIAAFEKKRFNANPILRNE